MKKKICALIVAFSIALAVILPVTLTAKKETAMATDGAKPIDIFIIAGQSNAAGESYTTGVTKETFSNIWYAGEAGPKPTNNGVKITNENTIVDGVTPGYAYDVTYPFNPVTLGLGSKGTSFGPEFGMAKYLNDKYSADHPAMIFKTATGGVGLYSYPNHEGGNFNQAGKNGDTKVGFLYRRLLENLENTLNSLEQNGYAPTIKAFVWMQGEAEMTGGKSVYMSYATKFRDFATSMRDDLSVLTSTSQSNLPFVIGEVSPTGGYGKPNASYVQQYRDEFIAVQRTIPNYLDNAYLVKSSAFETDYVSGNYWHWSGKDMVVIGEMFARTALLEKAMVSDVVSYGECKGIFAIPEINEAGDKITFTLKVSDGYGAQSFKINGTEVASSFVNGKYTIDYTDGDTFNLEMTSKKLEKFDIAVKRRPLTGVNITTNDAVYKNADGSMYVYEGSSLEITVTTKNGYEVTGVTINDQPYAYDASTGKITVELVTEDLEIEIASEQPGETPDETPETTPSGDSKKGCGKEGVGLALAGFATLLAAAFIMKK